MRHIVPLLLLILTLFGCIDHPVQIQINDRSYIGKPPVSVHLSNLGGTLETGFHSDPKSSVSIEVYSHCATCTNAQSRSLGSDFDGYTRITIKDGESVVARIQQDYKGKPDKNTPQRLYEQLMTQLQWKIKPQG